MLNLLRDTIGIQIPGPKTGRTTLVNTIVIMKQRIICGKFGTLILTIGKIKPKVSAHLIQTILSILLNLIIGIYQRIRGLTCTEVT